MTAAEAAALLGVKLQTLYAYASRGWLRSRSTPGTRQKRYDRADVVRLKDRAAARKGKGAVAKDVLDFGAPVVSTSITEITADGPRYRGHDPRALLAARDPFAACAAVLANDAYVDGAQLTDDALATAANDIARHVLQLAAVLRPQTLLEAVDVVLTAWRLRLTHVGSVGREQQVRRVVLNHVCAAPGLLAHPPRFVVERGAPGATLGAALGVSTVAAQGLLDTILVVLADHELNASTFTARVVASTGAATPACLVAGFAAVSGPLHGAACARVEAMLDELGPRRRASTVVGERIARGDAVVGFGHRLYPQGDPRAAWLLAHPIVQASAAAQPAFEVVAALQALVGVGPLSLPSVDLALVAAARALGLPPGTASGVFAIARCAGWLAHIAEQRQSGQVLRPRASWVQDAAASRVTL